MFLIKPLLFFGSIALMLAICMGASFFLFFLVRF